MGNCAAKSQANASVQYWHSPRVKGLPGARKGFSADVVGSNQVFIFGGEHGEAWLNDLYVLNTDKMVWRRLQLSGTPSKRSRVSYLKNKNEVHVDVVGHV